MQIPNTFVRAFDCYTVRYSHRHGEDICVYATELAAHRGIAITMQEWLEEFIDHEGDVAQLAMHIRDNCMDTAISLWEDAMEDEFFIVEGQYLYTEENLRPLQRFGEALTEHDWTNKEKIDE